MRILFHHRVGSIDGQGVHIDELTSALREMGHEVIVVGPSTVLQHPREGAAGWLTKFRRYLPRSIHELAELVYMPFAYVRLEAAFHKHRPDGLYERASLFNPAGLWLSQKHNLPLLLEVNSPLVLERSEFGGIAFKQVARWSEKVTWRGAGFVLPVTEILADIIQASGVDRERIVVIPNGVNLQRFDSAIDRREAKSRLGLADRTVLGFSGFAREWHRLDRVVEFIAKQDKREDLHLLVVGDGPARAVLEEQAKRAGIAERVCFTGFVNRDRLADYLRAFDVALQPGVTPYASPLKLFEYMALSLAIVAPDTANIREILVDGTSAVLFDPDRPGAFHGALERVCGDAGLRDLLGRTAWQVIFDRGLTWDNNARQVTALLEQLIVKKRLDTARLDHIPANRNSG
jgi:glycosyltransferase involved in cell wall biosynthesis